MKKSLVALMLLVTGVFGGAQRAVAGCMDDAGDAIWGALSGGASYAACVTAELVNTIRSLIDTVGRLVENVRRNGTEVANAALGVVRAGADEGRQALEGAQRTLTSSASKARQIASSATTALRSNVGSLRPQTIATAAQAQTSTTAAPGSQPSLRAGVAAPTTAALAPSSVASAAQTINLAADPARVRSALNRAAETVGGLESEISRDVASQVNAGLQRARQQAESHAATAADISRTLLEAPLLALKNSLLDMLAHPERLFDPSATINSQINIISNNIVDTMNRINDAVTRDALATLNAVEVDIRRAQGNADRADKIVKAMEHLARDKNQVALSQLESLIGGGAGGVPGSRPMPVALPTVFRADALRGRVDTATLRTIAPLKTATDSLRSQWAAIEAKRPTKTTSLDPRMQQQGKAELDRLFANKSPDEVQRHKADLLAKARQQFGSNPQLMAKIQQQLDREIGLRVPSASMRGAVAPQFKPASTQVFEGPQYKPGAAQGAVAPVAPAPVR